MGGGREEKMKRAPRWSSVHAPISDNGVKDLVKSGWVWGEEGEHPVKERRQCDEDKNASSQRCDGGYEGK